MNWRRFWLRKNRDSDLAEEIESYLAHEADFQASRGVPADDAAYAAQRKLGNQTLVRETVWEVNSLQMLESIWQDVVYAARTLRLNPGFFAVAIISLALGIGANSAIFQLLDSVRLSLLPVERADRLAHLKIVSNEHCCDGNFSGRHSEFTFAQWQQIQALQTGFSSVFAWSDEQFNLTPSGEAHLVEGLWVSGDYFKTLGVRPLLGRLIDNADDSPNCATAGAVVSYPFWQRQYGGNSAVLGKTILLNGHRFPVIGVTPASFFGVEVGRSFDVMLPLCAEVNGANKRTRQREAWWLAIMGRLKPWWTLERAMAEVKTISAAVFDNTVPEHYKPEQANYYRHYQLTALPGGSGISSLRHDMGEPLSVLLGITGLVLLIACANLANLTLARASAREREMAVRLAIGAGRVRLIRQLLTESLLLTFIGTALGVMVASFLCRYLVHFITTQQNPIFLTLTPDWRILAFTAGVAVLTCLLFGLMPAIRATQTPPAGVMKASGRGLTADRERFSLRRILVIAQVAMSLVLLAAALLFVRSLANLTSIDAGLRQDGMVIMATDISRLDYKPEGRAEVFRTLLKEVRATPGVELAASANIIPLSGDGSNNNIEIPELRKAALLCWFNWVSDGYFRTLGTPMLAGRDFDTHDTGTSVPVAIVHQAFVQKFLAGANPVGKHIRLPAVPGTPEHVYQIVGLVKNSKYQDLRESFKATAFLSFSQGEEVWQGVNLLVRSHVPVGALTRALQKAADNANPEMSITFLPFQTQVAQSLLRDRLMATLSSFFGFLAATLATAGLYGVISYMVARRRSEIGIRMALGASSGGVLRLILTEAGLLVAVGLAVGTALAIASSSVASSFLYGLTATDPLTISTAVLLLATVAMLASFLPAHRASRIEPMLALREE